ncbi:MAG: EamA family transporter [Henriciella sp.]|jgi:drug/metabolite transporter (DMT)-like permease|uniref:DMT family transporter n=1 Tax=Henriciella sp. TaxID=1968823 RepID=UPI000C10C70C|nr:DMT family transporter [Henriciella sp.]MAN73393.1 EamA family transporter [Henriciella sp.]MBF33560.1 EamA family transporter [Hyphomonadaceae bacterium]MBK76332.1 EamA family transporter [Henriciella sp.]PHR76900.1 MAG: EamA family transporter [Henriciella sp.]|tara:strand:+ start:459 stop:1316 length:858 start_codon:yes stop_codon:yes gene_type:complete
MMPSALRLFFITGLAMTAFAANSVLARLAMAGGEAGPWAFTLLRILSGALVLALIVSPGRAVRAGSWASAAALLAYAAFFSLAYLSLTTGTGALILFALVQITMIGWGLAIGERLSAARWAGMALAVGGLVWLLMPGLQAPPLTGALLMAVAGVGWGIYSLRGRNQRQPTLLTAGNFARAAALSLLIGLPALLVSGESAPSVEGAAYALASGAITSALGYAIWYAALRDLSASLAAIAQLTVPAIAALGGMIFLEEPLTVRFLIATALILGGVALASLSRRKARA